ncbi:polymer-forming cytoskeletal protein [Flavobacteriaceae bacterium 144Ye]|jgi:cytoskeletal protein CcmA (bactofilin family)|uniref:Polymer-forming cytoskeletal protein n=3 Tax=Flavobacteriales TaxID=200644 RepID=A0ABP3UKV5_9FLAO|nr:MULTISPECIES: polymer-forming cytoskeletal protein [Flavobacteriaceae]RYH76178.1 polymer-forming cytoskeletal protein [Flavobacteriaceae bacterium 144Ye]TDY13614.1 cytoskeletal protein CcmA (bactofilin family) [Meridianimaribacter flavus]
MFSDQKRGRMATETISQQNSIAKGTTITGDIISDGDFRIEGTVQGNIKTPGKVVIGRTGVINGTLKSSNADIEGKFSGKLILSDTLSLKSSAFVEGEVEVGKLAVEPGATFNATCAMKGAIKELSKGGELQRPAQEKQGQGQSA